MKDNIRLAALEIIALDGIDKLTMGALGERIGLAKATLYHYYKSKEEIIDDIFTIGHKHLMKNGFSLDMKKSCDKLFLAIAENWKKLLKDDDNYLFLRAISELKLVNERAAEENNAIKLMLKSQAETVATKIENRDQKSIAFLFSSILFSLIDEVLSEEISEDDIVNNIESFISLIAL